MAEIAPAQKFSRFARYYDAFMDYIDYPGWVQYIMEILDTYGIKGKKLLDLACGTGTCAVLFAKKGFEVYGIDVSEDMLEQARKKISAMFYNIGFSCQDLRNFKLEKKVDVVTCLYDSMNYLLEEEDVRQAFGSAYNALNNGGAFIFDLNTEYALSVVWGNGVMRRREGGFPSLWRNFYDPETHTGTLHLTWTIKENGSKKEYYETHRERAYPNSRIEEFLKEAGFKEAMIFSHRTFEPPAEISPRVMVVAVT